MGGGAEDREAIREVLARYVHLWDQGRSGEVAALFREADGEWRSKFGRAVGRAEVAALLARIAGGRVRADGSAPARRHFNANISIRLDGAAAEVVSDFFVLEQTAQGLAAVSMGQYRDAMVKEGSDWLFRARVIVHPG